MKQAPLEAEMRDMGVSRYWRKVRRTTEKEMESNHPIGRRLLTESINVLTEAIRSWKSWAASGRAGPQHAAYDYIDKLESPMVAALTARAIIDSISMHSRIVKTANTISRMLEDEVRWRELSNKTPKLFRKHIEQTKRKRGHASKRRHMVNLEQFVDLNFSTWPRSVCVKVGVVLIELMRQSTGLIEVETRTGLMGKRDTFVRPTEVLLEWMKNAHNSAEDLTPIFMPMVESPKNWKTLWDGGYLTENIHRRPLVKSSDKKHLEELNNSSMIEPIAAINCLQRVGWRINSRVFQCMKYCWENDIPAGGLPPTQGEKIPSKPIDIGTNKESRRKWRKLAAKIHYDNESEESRRLQVAQVLWLGNKFINETIWMPWYMDFRGRMYPRPYGLQPQGPDWSRSLLKFAKPEQMTVEGEYWLAIHGANCYGYDKEPFAKRLEWVHDNDGWIQAIAKDPEGSVTEWSSVDEPWAFLSFCLEWYEYKKQGLSLQTSLPCSIDGSSNGLQILSLIMRDPIGARATNVITSGDTPRDIYQDVADATIERLKLSPDPLADIWLRFGIDRSCAKRPTMVVPYSGTLFAVQKYVTMWFRDEMKKRSCENPFGWEELYKPCTFLASVIWDALGDIVGEARKAMTWFQECSDICIECSTPIRWTTPSGFRVKQSYENWQNQTIKTIIGDVVRRHKINVGTGVLSKVKNRNGIAPNWVHSIDSAVGQRSLLDCQKSGIFNLNAIHDSFWSSAPNMKVLRQVLLNNIVSIFSEDLLGIFRKELSLYLPSGVNLPEPPNVGDLDISRVRDSIYFFS